MLVMLNITTLSYHNVLIGVQLLETHCDCTQQEACQTLLSENKILETNSRELQAVRRTVNSRVIDDTHTVYTNILFNVYV